MIAKELQHRFKHYTLLIVIISILFALYLFGTSPLTRALDAVMIGITYMAWGIWTHTHELKTSRVVLEYVAVGILGSLILGILAFTV